MEKHFTTSSKEVTTAAHLCRDTKHGTSTYKPSSIGLKYVDHMVGNVGWNEMNKWVEFYAKVMGFAQLVSFDDKDISTEYTALMSKVMSNGNGRIKFPHQRTC
jgi:4-hydroxyphenylpyruvate dioxygenase-like putative hemolysin